MLNIFFAAVNTHQPCPGNNSDIEKNRLKQVKLNKILYQKSFRRKNWYDIVVLFFFFPSLARFFFFLFMPFHLVWLLFAHMLHQISFFLWLMWITLYNIRIGYWSFIYSFNPLLLCFYYSTSYLLFRWWKETAFIILNFNCRLPAEILFYDSDLLILIIKENLRLVVN